MTKIINLFNILCAFVAIFSTRVSGQTALPTIFTDEAFVDDDVCSMIINEHPCVKNVLSVLVDHINQNLQRIQLIEENTKETKNDLHSKIKELLLAQTFKDQKLEVSHSETKDLVNNLKNKLEGTLIQNKMLRNDIRELKLKLQPKEEFAPINAKEKNSDPNNLKLQSFLDNLSGSNWFQKNDKRLKVDNSSVEFGRLYKEEKSTHNPKKSKKWYDSKIWENVGEILYDQFQEFTKQQDSTDDDELKRSFPVKPPSDRYKFAKNKDGENEVYDYTEEYTAPKVKDKPFERDVWRRMGQAIDRQFLALGGGVQGLLAGAISAGPVVVPAATLTLAGTNFYNNANQENVLAEQKSSADALAKRVSAAESTLESSSSSATTAALEARIATLETKMTNVIDFTFDRLCTVLEYVSTGTNQFICCANKDVGKLYCAEGTGQAGIFDIGEAGQGTCDETGLGTAGKTWICSA